MNDPEGRAIPYWWQSVAPSVGSGGLLGSLVGENTRPRGLLSQFDPPDETWDRSIPSWVGSTMPFGRAGGIPGLPRQPVGQPWFNPISTDSSAVGWPPSKPSNSLMDVLGEMWRNPPHGPSLVGLTKSLYNAARFPLDHAAGAYVHQPQTPGVWTEEDQFLKDKLNERMIERAFDFAGLGLTGPVPVALGAKAPQSTLGVFVGPFGAERLAKGLPHPAVDPRRALTDHEAQAMLNARQQAGDLRDADIFRRSAWFRGADGMPRKELVDTGAQLVATGRVNDLGREHLWKHPAGDMHKIYDIPPITIMPRAMDAGRGTTNLRTRSIQVNEGVTAGETLGTAAHELQHAIQLKEGFAPGTNPVNEVLFPDYWKALGQPFPRGRGAMQTLREHADVIRQGIEDDMMRETPQFKAALATYWKAAGEVEARNVVDHLFGAGGYVPHPRETASVPLPNQIVRDPVTTYRRYLDAVRRGF